MFNSESPSAVKIHFQQACPKSFCMTVHSHKEDDCFCRQWTDPNLYPQLKKDGSWIFNSSAAEISNIWYGGFASICRNMTAVQYNFFLDEMVRLHNIGYVQSYPNDQMLYILALSLFDGEDVDILLLGLANFLSTSPIIKE
ncbi:hypothetical protein H4Q26_006822 [Puccinia striiformis f. sp. tritici PST-130]|nr:hypothetical protein H4Q26_006822 [Puccinia striiformis f. sp. tritici PST-130]